MIYSFLGGRDGAAPQAGLVALRGSLYGTTSGGGTGSSSNFGNGTVFKVTPSGTERVLHRFGGYPNDGAFPTAGLTVAQNILYGTTISGGNGPCYDQYRNPAGCGTIFKVTRLGKETALHVFGNAIGSQQDGVEPAAGLTFLNGVLYGTTTLGGNGHCQVSTMFGCGTVFKIDRDGTGYQILYNFKNGRDGAYPNSGLTASNGVLYGVTGLGGKCGATSGSGTLFAIRPSGNFRVLHCFAGGKDGAIPLGNLLAVNTQLYGTTFAGGSPNGWGTVFRVSTSAQEHVVYRFKGPPDGDSPNGALISLNGMLQGTTQDGGARGINSGTIFAVRTSGTETVLYRFKSGKDGYKPLAGLTTLNGALYGTTEDGGAAPDNGTIFELMP